MRVSRSSMSAKPNTVPINTVAMRMMNGATYSSMCATGIRWTISRVATAITREKRVMAARKPSR